MLAIKNERENSIESSGFRLNRFSQTTDTYHVSDRHRYDYICRLSFLTYFFVYGILYRIALPVMKNNMVCYIYCCYYLYIMHFQWSDDQLVQPEVSARKGFKHRTTSDIIIIIIYFVQKQNYNRE